MNKPIRITIICISTFILLLFVVSNVMDYKYKKGFTVEIYNNTNEIIDKISFKLDENESEALIFEDIKPNSDVNKHIHFSKKVKGKNFYASYTNPNGKEQIIRCLNVTSENNRNAVKLYINGIDGNKDIIYDVKSYDGISTSTRKSIRSNGFTSILIPWWIDVIIPW